MEIDEKTGELKIDSSETSSSEADKSDRTEDELNLSNLTVTESTEETSTSDPDDSTLSTESTKRVAQRKLYKLTAVVCQIINGNQRNLVALVRVGRRYQEAKNGEYDASNENGQWYIFNDFR